MKKLLLILLAIPFLATAQETTESTKQKEFAILFRSLDNFGLSYRFGKTDALWRIDLLSFGGNESSFAPPDTSPIRKSQNISFGLQTGREYRKELKEKIELRYGFGISGRYDVRRFFDISPVIGQNYESIDQTLTAGIIGIFGINYHFNSSLAIGVEINPQISYSESWGKVKYDNAPSSDSGTSSFALFDFNSQLAILSLMVRF